MKRVAPILLLLVLTVAPSMQATAQHENTSIGENAREAKKAERDQQKASKKLGKQQRKAMKKYQKAQRKAAKQQQRHPR